MKITPSARKLCFVLLAASALAGAQSAPAADATKSLRVYFIGNSVTDTVRYGSLAKLAASRGHQLAWGRQMIPGSPLQWLWDHPSDGFTEKPFGYPREAFTNFQWDVVSLQPFDRGLTSKDGSDDVTKIRQYAEMIATQSPGVQIYLYARWPRVTSGGKALEFDKNDYDPAQPENLQRGIMVTDTTLEGPAGPRIIYVNRAWLKMTGYGRDELAGKTPRLLQGKHTDPAVVSSLKQKLLNREVFHGQTWNYRKSGEPFLMNWYCYAIYGERPKPIYYVAEQEDVTELEGLPHEATTSRQP